MRKAQRIRESCDYQGLIDGTLLRSTRQHVTSRNVHQIIFKPNKDTIIDAAPLVHAGNAFLIGLMDYNPSGNSALHKNHAVSALLIEGRLYCFNAKGNTSKSMKFLVKFMKQKGFKVDSFIQYSGPDLQAQDFSGVCTAFAARFLKLSPNVSMNQDQYNEYIVSKLSIYTIPELAKYIERISGIRNVGIVSSNNNNNNRNRKRKSVRRNMNINRNGPVRMNINRNGAVRMNII